MKRLALIAAMLLITPVYAEEPAPAAPPVSQVAPQLFYFEVDQNDINAISSALNELPKRVADPLILKLSSQLKMQAQIMANRAKVMTPEPAPSSTLSAHDMADKPSKPTRHYRHYRTKVAE
jgi:hypothetical protein